MVISMAPIATTACICPAGHYWRQRWQRAAQTIISPLLTATSVAAALPSRDIEGGGDDGRNGVQTLRQFPPPPSTNFLPLTIPFTGLPIT